ncbi:hypothetical protein [Streptomyces sp. MP131-18]|uniref:hypothetical protein n=1 Tax=Streptomyces sp. MP131-18 TaxID=1857892 RepID=UPI00097C4DBD|nr:hypothetical protein [Streptomyces sp. MP131-18]ONK12648.1 hypothetical protein STBA_33960 [Streptomyces sp. MP131-18]
MECELALGGDVPPGAHDELTRRLYDAGAATRVAPQWVRDPEPGRRAGEFIAVATLAVTFSGTLVAVVDVVRRWLIEGRERRSGARRGVTTIVLKVDGTELVITEPSTDGERQVLEHFLRTHAAGRTGNGPGDGGNDGDGGDGAGRPLP